MPFYHDLKHELVNPDRGRIQTEYFWRKWAPKFGPTLACLVIALRSYCYTTSHQGTPRLVLPEQEGLGLGLGISVDIIQGELKRPEAASFIRRGSRRDRDPERENDDQDPTDFRTDHDCLQREC